MRDRFLISRDELAKFISNNDTLRRFEKLFQQVVDTFPDNFDIIFSLLNELSINIGTAESKAVAANDLIAYVARALETDPGTLWSAVNSLQSSLIDFSRSFEADPDSLRASINSLRSSVVSIVRELELEPGSIRAAVNQVADALISLSRSLEVDSSRPAFQFPRTFSVDYIDWDENPNAVGQTRRMEWNPTDDTLNLHHSDGVTQQMGQELYGRIFNNTGVTIPNGACLGINPATNSYVLFTANGTLSPITIVGVTTQAIPNNTNGRITVWGRVRDIDTTGTPYGEVWAAGNILYVSTTIAGGFTKVKPTAPNLSMPIAQVLTVNATTGQIAVRPTIEQQLFYGQFAKTTDQSPTVINTATALTWSSALIANGVSIGAPASRIVVANAGLYKFSISLQLTSSSASVKNVWIWFRKNGVDVANSTLLTALDTSSVPRTPSRDLFFSLVANDYVEVMFASDSLNMTVDSIPATAFAPAAPAALLSVNQEQQ